MGISFYSNTFKFCLNQGRSWRRGRLRRCIGCLVKSGVTKLLLNIIYIIGSMQFTLEIIEMLKNNEEPKEIARKFNIDIEIG